MFKLLWEYGWVICFVDGWFEWKKEGNKKQLYFIQCKDDQLIFMVVIGWILFECGDYVEGFLIVMVVVDCGFVDIYDCWLLVLMFEVVCEWMRQDVIGVELVEIVSDGVVFVDDFIWYLVMWVVGNVKNQGFELFVFFSL